MLRGLFGSKNSNSSKPPKNQIEVVCPKCGAAQFEPRLVVSTFCKKCGVHLSISKKKVTASSASRSGVGMGDLWEQPDTRPAPPPQAKETSPAPDAPPPGSHPKTAGGLRPMVARPAAPADKETIPDEITIGEAPDDESQAPSARDEGFGEALHLDESATQEDETFPQPRRAMSNAPAPTPAPPPASASTLQKMREQGFYRQQYFKDARCFDCDHRFKVGRSAKSANCPQCGSYISLEDVEINMNSTQPVKTRGDVLIRKRGHLSTSTVQCKDLRCYGLLEANVRCDSDAVFRTEGNIIGEICCHRFVVEKGANVTFLNPVRANEMEIQGCVSGALFSTGPVLINAYGSVNGDVTARSVAIEPGGELNGAMFIVRNQAPVVAPPEPEDLESLDA